jgi:mono/diheme cytochrome c family protein
VLAVAFVMLGIIYFGVKSEYDDQHDGAVSSQLAKQDQQEKAYTAAPFEPYVESPGGTGPLAVPTGPPNPLVSHGKGIFEAHGCSGCHGATGTGTSAAPTLVGIAIKFSQAQLIGLLHDPTAKMRAGHMPAIDISAEDMSALLSYLAVLGTSAANVPASSGASPAQPSSQGREANSKPGTPGSTQPGSSIKLFAVASAGEQMFEERGCIGCHGPAGSGTAKAPAIFPLIAKLSHTQIAQLLLAPNAKMKLGGMPAVDASPADLASLVAYLRTLPAPQLGKEPQAERAISSTSAALEQSPSPTASTPSSRISPATAAAPTIAFGGAQPTAGHALFVSQGCAACHGPSGEGTHFAPSLIGVGKKFPGSALPTLLYHPTSKMRAGGMPTVKVNDAQLAQLVAFLSSLAPASVVTPAAQGNASSTAPASKPGSAASSATQAPPAQQAAPVPLSPLALRGQIVFQRNSCESCHGVGGLTGTVAAPPLAGTASVLPTSVLEDLLRHHSIQMQKGGMPLTNMNAQDMKSIIAFIRSMPAEGQ